MRRWVLGKTAQTIYISFYACIPTKSTPLRGLLIHVHNLDPCTNNWSAQPQNAVKRATRACYGQLHYKQNCHPPRIHGNDQHKQNHVYLRSCFGLIKREKKNNTLCRLVQSPNVKRQWTDHPTGVFPITHARNWRKQAITHTEASRNQF